MKHRLKIGDKIAELDSRHVANSIHEVTRTTETMAFCRVIRAVNTYELKFPREVPNEGIFTEKGDTRWQKTWYCIASEINFQQVREGNLRIKITRLDWSQVSIEKIEQILNMLSK